MKITSSEFKNNETIPKVFTCTGDSINPPLQFSEVPLNTKSLALIVEDPDTPMGITWYHWVVFNIPPETKGIDQNSKPKGAVEGMGSGNSVRYQGPCPPDPKAHRYFFSLYALDTMLDLPKTTDADELHTAIDHHIIEETRLTGIYTGPAKKN